MQSSIRTKTKQLRDQFRRSQVEAYRTQIREELLRSKMLDNQKNELNLTTQQLITNGNLKDLYDYLYCKKVVSHKEVPIAHLYPETISSLLDFLLKNIRSIEGLLLLGNLFDLHYVTIFVDANTRQRARQIVRIIYQETNASVRAYIESGRNKEVEKLANGILYCLKSIIFNKDEPNSLGETFIESMREDYICGYLFGWFDILCLNLPYLIILSVVEYDINMSSLAPIKAKLNNDSQTVITLLSQSDPMLLKHKGCALPAIALANSFIKVITNESVLEQLVIPCLESTKIIYSYLQQQGVVEYYRSHTFYDSLSSVVEIFKRLEKTYLHKHLGELMTDCSYWVFAGLLLRTETFVIRTVIYEIVRNAVRNIVVCKGRLEEYLSETIVGLLGEGLESENVEIVECNLQTFLCMFEYIGENEDASRHMVAWIREFDIDSGLENLAYSSNGRLKELAQVLMAKKEGLKREMVRDMQEECL